jgi:signal transduction histidine kinase
MSVFYFVFLSTQIGDTHAILKDAFENEAVSKGQAKVTAGILDGVPGIVSVIDDQLIYRSINQFGVDFLGFNPTGQQVGWKSENPGFEASIRDFYYSPKRQSSFEMEMFHNNRSNWFFISLRKLFAPLNGMIVVSIPIDELKQAQQEVEAQKSKADYSARLASLGEMAAGIAHEINNPLAIISAKSQFLVRMLSSHESKDAKTAEMVELGSGIVKTIDRITKIIKGLRTFAKDGSTDAPSEVSVQSVIDETVVFCETRFKTAGIRLNVQVQPDIQFSVQSIQISQVILNLLNNAFDAVEKTVDPEVTLTAGRNGDQIEIRVVDNGPGIPAHVREKIMQPFFTTKEVGKGTGLGLSISRGIIAFHGGSLGLEPRTDKTEFLIVLPIESRIKSQRAA